MLSKRVDSGISQQLFQAIEERLGIDCKQRQSRRVLEAIERQAQANNYDDAQQFIIELLRNPEHRAWYQMDEIFTIQTTEFFRESRQMAYFKNELLPNLKQRKIQCGDNRIRFWSCGCATGEEAYSLAMYVREVFNHDHDWDIKILASDVHQGALAHACSGLYDVKAMSSVPQIYRDQFFIPSPEHIDGQYRIKASIQSLIEFRSINLMAKEYPVKPVFDGIFCRNLLIYMTDNNLHLIISNLRQKLVENGCLFLGHSEHLRNPLDLERDKYNIFRVPVLSEASQQTGAE